MSKIIENLYEIVQKNLKRSSFIWKKSLREVLDNWKTFTYDQSAGILLAIYKFNLHQSDEGIRIANLFMGNVEKYINSSNHNFIAETKLIRLYYELNSIHQIEQNQINVLNKMLLHILDVCKTEQVEQLTKILPLLAISSPINSSHLDTRDFYYIYDNLLEFFRDKSIQKFVPEDSNTALQLVDQISLLAFTLSHSKHFDRDITELLLLIGEAKGNLTSLLRLHNAISRLSEKYNVTNYLSTITLQLDNQYKSIWNSKSQLIASSREICHLKMCNSPYIKKLYQYLCNSIESIDKLDKHDLCIYLKNTLREMDINDIQYPFLEKLSDMGVLDKFHRANVKWNFPLPSGNY